MREEAKPKGGAVRYDVDRMILNTVERAFMVPKQNPPHLQVDMSNAQEDGERREPGAGAHVWPHSSSLSIGT